MLASLRGRYRGHPNVQRPALRGIPFSIDRGILRFGRLAEAAHRTACRAQGRDETALPVAIDTKTGAGFAYLDTT